MTQGFINYSQIQQKQQEHRRQEMATPSLKFLLIESNLVPKWTTSHTGENI